MLHIALGTTKINPSHINHSSDTRPCLNFWKAGFKVLKSEIPVGSWRGFQRHSTWDLSPKLSAYMHFVPKLMWSRRVLGICWFFNFHINSSKCLFCSPSSLNQLSKFRKLSTYLGSRHRDCFSLSSNLIHISHCYSAQAGLNSAILSQYSDSAHFSGHITIFVTNLLKCVGEWVLLILLVNFNSLTLFTQTRTPSLLDMIDLHNLDPKKKGFIPCFR